MAYVEQALGLLVKLEPDKARRKIEAAYRRAGTLREAAAALGVSRRSLMRWRRLLGVAA